MERLMCSSRPDELFQRYAAGSCDLCRRTQMFFRPALLFLQIKRRILDGNETATPDGRFDEPVTLQFLIGTLYGDYTDVQGLRQAAHRRDRIAGTQCAVHDLRLDLGINGFAAVAAENDLHRLSPFRCADCTDSIGTV